MNALDLISNRAYFDPPKVTSGGDSATGSLRRTVEPREHFRDILTEEAPRDLSVKEDASDYLSLISHYTHRGKMHRAVSLLAPSIAGRSMMRGCQAAEIAALPRNSRCKGLPYQLTCLLQTRPSVCSFLINSVARVIPYRCRYSDSKSQAIVAGRKSLLPV